MDRDVGHVRTISSCGQNLECVVNVFGYSRGWRMRVPFGNSCYPSSKEYDVDVAYALTFPLCRILI